ncbi:MAG: cupredoxin domain-containing protein [Candidatus Aenigmarchaeota archaeon]|nr:cupredoxin domain-containing protein [Candidatus Aenigmarchaeota archaeon]
MDRQQITQGVGIVGLAAILLFVLVSLPYAYLNLVSAKAPDPNGNANNAGSAPAGDGAVREVTLQFRDYNYYPNTINVKKGQTVRLVADLQSQYKLIGCYTYLRIPSLGIAKQLTARDNVVEFKADQEGTIPFACGMNMGKGRIVVA